MFGGRHDLLFRRWMANMFGAPKAVRPGRFRGLKVQGRHIPRHATTHEAGFHHTTTMQGRARRPFRGK